ncbi:MAG: hypothetical protein AB8F26_03015 [Phycisphaerales bacterium]
MLGYERRHAGGRGFADVKTILACGFAAAGVGLAGWSFFSGGGGEAEPERENREVISTLDADGNATEADYETTRGDDATRVVSALAQAASVAARSLGGFESRGDDAVAAFGPSIELALTGLISGDHDAFMAAMAALGGAIPGELDGEHPVFSRLKEKLEGAKVDLARLEVKPHQNRRGGPRMEQRPERDPGAAREKRNYSERVMEIRSGSMFESASASLEEGALDVRFPFLPKGEEKEEWFGLVLVWDGDIGKWQPGAFQMIKREVTVSP